MLKLALLLIFTVSVLSFDQKLGDKIFNTLCHLAHGANDSDDPIKILDAECRPDCHKKQIVFVCEKLEHGSFCADVESTFGGFLKMISGEFKCKEDNKKATVSLK